MLDAPPSKEATPDGPVIPPKPRRGVLRRARILHLRTIAPIVSLACFVYFASSLAGDILDPSIRSAQDPVSQIALGPYEPLYFSAVTFAAIAGLATAVGLRMGLRPSRALRRGTACLGLGCIALVGLPIFRVDAGLNPSTVAGVLHVVLATGGFALIGIAPFLYAGAFGRDTHWRKHLVLFKALAWGIVGVVAVLAVANVAARTQFPQPGHYFTGALERVMIVMFALWLVAASLELRRTAKLPEHVVELDGDVKVR